MASICIGAVSGALTMLIILLWRGHYQRLREREQEARRIEDMLNPIIDELSEEMGHQMPHIRIEWED